MEIPKIRLDTANNFVTDLANTIGWHQKNDTMHLAPYVQVAMSLAVERSVQEAYLYLLHVEAEVKAQEAKKQW